VHAVRKGRGLVAQAEREEFAVADCIEARKRRHLTEQLIPPVAAPGNGI
jgi:hypothetical protein